MTVNKEINQIAREIKEEVNSEVDLSIGSIENPAQATTILCERMDTICALMDYQAELIKRSETTLEEAKYQFEKKKLLAKKKYNTAFVGFKQEDRQKPRNERRTDKEYEALADLEASVSTNESLTAEREYWRANHYLSAEKHRYEILNNHFLSYRKASDLLMREFSKLGDYTIKQG